MNKVSIVIDLRNRCLVGNAARAFNSKGQAIVSGTFGARVARAYVSAGKKSGTAPKRCAKASLAGTATSRRNSVIVNRAWPRTARGYR